MRLALALMLATLPTSAAVAAVAAPDGVTAFGPSSLLQRLQAEPPDVQQDDSQPAPPPPPAWLRRRQAEVEVLDKIDALSRQLTVPVGQSVQFSSLTIAVQACGVRPPGKPPDAAAYLVITDSHPEQPGFRGWMLQQEPWVAMLQSPVYDVRLMGCRS